MMRILEWLRYYECLKERLIDQSLALLLLLLYLNQPRNVKGRKKESHQTISSRQREKEINIPRGGTCKMLVVVRREPLV